jgi:UDP:flavonoid glycosyltransferase YjiC (YdhE family)
MASVAAAEVAGPFYEHSVTAAERLGRRAGIIVGKNARHCRASLPDGVIACDYAPFSELFPRAAVIVHAGGVGTTGLAMRSGRPMLVVPYAHDQFDNAARVARAGIARTIPRRRYTPTRVVAELGQLLDNPMYAERTSETGERVRQEDGVRAACDALEELLSVDELGVTFAGSDAPTAAAVPRWAAPLRGRWVNKIAGTAAGFARKPGSRPRLRSSFSPQPPESNAKGELT